ncbi:MAG: hypothetical protein ACKVS8_00775 [Phycisphaerales bacterium]
MHTLPPDVRGSVVRLFKAHAAEAELAGHRLAKKCSRDWALHMQTFRVASLAAVRDRLPHNHPERQGASNEVEWAARPIPPWTNVSALRALTDLAREMLADTTPMDARDGHAVWDAVAQMWAVSDADLRPLGIQSDVWPWRSVEGAAHAGRIGILRQFVGTSAQWQSAVDRLASAVKRLEKRTPLERMTHLLMAVEGLHRLHIAMVLIAGERGGVNHGFDDDAFGYVVDAARATALSIADHWPAGAQDSVAINARDAAFAKANLILADLHEGSTPANDVVVAGMLDAADVLRTYIKPRYTWPSLTLRLPSRPKQLNGQGGAALRWRPVAWYVAVASAKCPNERPLTLKQLRHAADTRGSGIVSQPKGRKRALRQLEVTSVANHAVGSRFRAAFEAAWNEGFEVPPRKKAAETRRRRPRASKPTPRRAKRARGEGRGRTRKDQEGRGRPKKART